MEIPTSRPEAIGSRFVSVRGKLHASQLALPADAALLHGLSPRLEITEQLVTEVNDLLETAVLPVPRGAGASSPRAIAIKQKRQELFGKLELEAPDSSLAPAIRKVKQDYRGNYPSPLNIFRNGRLLQLVGAPLAPTFASNPDFITANIDLEGLDAIEPVLHEYGLSFEETPGLLLRKPETAAQDLWQLQGALHVLGLPLRLRDIVHLRPDISPQRHNLFMHLAAQHGDLRSYIRDVRSSSKREGPISERLLADVIESTYHPVEPYLISVIEEGEFRVSAINSLVWRLRRSATARREILLNALGSRPDAIPHLGRQIVKMYFDRAPLSPDEVSKHPYLAAFAKDDPPKKMTAAERLHEERLTPEDQVWLEEIMDRPISSEELPILLGLLNNAILHGDSQMLKRYDEETLTRIRESRFSFFELLGWMEPGHRMYAAFGKYITRSTGYMTAPMHVVRIGRELAVPARGTLLDVFRVAHCRVLKSSTDVVQARVEEATRKAKLEHASLEEVIAYNLYNFVNGKPLKDIPPAPITDLLSLLDKEYTEESLLAAAPNVQQLSNSEFRHLVELARGHHYTVDLDGRWVFRRTSEIIRRRT